VRAAQVGMQRTVRLADIAERLGVSTVTVSKALAGKDGVSEAVRAEIRRIAWEMGYSRPKDAKQAGSRDDEIGIVVASRFMENRTSFYWQMYEKVIQSLARKSLYGLLEILSPEDEEGLTPPRMLLENRVSGLIVVGSVSDRYLQFLRGFPDIPAVCLDSYGLSNCRDAVISDGYYGMYVMTQHLLELGHADIAFVGTVGSTSSIRDRYYGFLRAMAERGLEVGSDRVLPDRDAEGNLMTVLPDSLPTAFACNCDISAYNLIGALRQEGIRVPEDISVVGFDNCVLSDLSQPAITTYAVNLEGMAEAAVGILSDKRNGIVSGALRVISGQPVIKGSTAAPNGANPPGRREIFDNTNGGHCDATAQLRQPV